MKSDTLHRIVLFVGVPVLVGACMAAGVIIGIAIWALL